ncbi:MAG: LacI family transcriptional regulator [Magnetospirillum sp.]|nr:LacI family transcriptional regulator [Magnetospirillum sp.]
MKLDGEWLNVTERMNSKPSLVDVAKRANVSISTVSRTITGTGKISEETQEHVRQVMRELGYKPNRVARRLRAREGKRHLIGLIIPNIQNPFFADLARGVEDVAYKNNFAVMLCNYDEDPKKELFYLDVMQAEQVDGIILPPAHEEDADVQRVRQSGIPVVCVDRSLSDPTIDKVEVDNEQGSFEAVAHLIKKGHKRIGLISGPGDTSTGRERLEGYRRAHREAGIAVDETLIRYGDYKQPSGRDIAAELLSLAKPPTALFACNNLMLIGAIETIFARKLKIPQQVALIGYDDLPLAAVFDPPLTVVQQPAYEVGQRAAELLFKRLEDPGAPAGSLQLAPKLIARGSC